MAPTKVQAWDRVGEPIVWDWGRIEKYCPSKIASPSAWRPFRRSLLSLYGDSISPPPLHTTPLVQAHPTGSFMNHSQSLNVNVSGFKLKAPQTGVVLRTDASQPQAIATGPGRSLPPTAIVMTLNFS